MPSCCAADLACGNLLGLDTTPWQPDASQTPSWNRGSYLVNGPGHCGECHTPRNLIMARDNSRFMMGGPHPEGQGKVPSLHGLVETGGTRIRRISFWPFRMAKSLATNTCLPAAWARSRPTWQSFRKPMSKPLPNISSASNKFIVLQPVQNDIGGFLRRFQAGEMPAVGNFRIAPVRQGRRHF